MTTTNIEIKYVEDANHAFGYWSWACPCGAEQRTLIKAHLAELECKECGRVWGRVDSLRYQSQGDPVATRLRLLMSDD